MEDGPPAVDNPMARVTFDEATRTLVVRVLDGGAERACFEEVKAAFEVAYEALHGSGAPRVSILFDLSGCGWVSPAYVAEWADLFRRHAPVTDAVVERTVISGVGPVARLALRAFFALYPSTRPVDIE